MSYISSRTRPILRTGAVLEGGAVDGFGDVWARSLAACSCVSLSVPNQRRRWQPPRDRVVSDMPVTALPMPSSGSEAAPSKAAARRRVGSLTTRWGHERLRFEPSREPNNHSAYVPGPLSDHPANEDDLQPHRGSE